MKENTRILTLVFVVAFLTLLVGCEPPVPLPTKTYTITATAGPGGSISPSGKVIVNEGSDKSFTITADSVFYSREDVLVDGDSIGAVSSYTFSNVTEDHTISATFYFEGPVYNQDNEDYFSTIQDAVSDDGNHGDGILVMAGVYPENVVIPPDKDGTQLIGAGSDVTSIAPKSGRAVALNGNEGLVDGIRIQGFTLATADDNYAFIALSGTVVVPSTTNLILEDIVVDGSQRGICLNAVKGVNFIDVHICAVPLHDDGNIELRGVSDFTFTQGSIIGSYIGIRLRASAVKTLYGPNGNIHIHDSSFSDNVIAIENQDASTIIDATNNWWGDASGPSHSSNPDGKGDAVSDNVDFDPWSTSPN